MPCFQYRLPRFKRINRWDELASSEPNLTFCFVDDLTIDIFDSHYIKSNWRLWNNAINLKKRRNLNETTLSCFKNRFFVVVMGRLYLDYLVLILVFAVLGYIILIIGLLLYLRSFHLCCVILLRSSFVFLTTIFDLDL